MASITISDGSRLKSLETPIVVASGASLTSDESYQKKKIEIIWPAQFDQHNSIKKLHTFSSNEVSLDSNFRNSCSFLELDAKAELFELLNFDKDTGKIGVLDVGFEMLGAGVR